MKSITIILSAVLLIASMPCRAQEAKADDSMLNAIGALGAQGGYSTHRAIEELVDLYEAKIYEDKKALELAGGYAGICRVVKENLAPLLKSGKLGEADAAALAKMIEINDMLVKMADGVIAYIKEPTEDNKAAYDKNRQKSWTAISKFLGIEE